MTSISQQAPASSTTNATQNASPAHSPTSVPGSSVPAAVPAAGVRSYASATKKQISPPIASSSSGQSPAVAIGGSAVPQHGKSSSVSPVNGKNTIPPAVPALVPPTIVNSSNAVNGAPGRAEHGRTPSVANNASGQSGWMPNGGPVPGPPSRTPNIQFGSINNGSPAITHSVPQPNQHTSSLTAGLPNNPRVTSPQTSPSPIPQPAASGGRPPSGLQGQGNTVTSVTFGSLGGDATDNTRQMRPVSMPPQPPMAPNNQQGHLRRESAQSTHSDMGNGNMGPGSRYAQQGSRGRGYAPQYPQHQQMGYSPGPTFRTAPNQPRGVGMPPQFQGQGGPMNPYPNSPHRASRSPAITHAAPGTPQMAQVPMANPQLQSPQFGYPMGPPQTQYGMPPQYDPNYGYPQAPYAMYPQMQYMGGQPSSPRPPYQHLPPGGQQHYIPGQYAASQPQPMSRTSSAVSDQRPNSSLGQQPTPSMTPATSHILHPPVVSGSPAPTSNAFTKPPKSNRVVIKNPQGDVVTFGKATPASPAPVSQSPAIVSSTPTPPPGPAGRNLDTQHTRTDSKSIKTDEEKKNEMRDAIAKKIEADIAEEKQKKEEEERLQKEKDDAERAKKEAEEKEQREREEAEKARKEAEIARKEAEEKARKEEEDRIKKEKEDQARREAEEKAKAEEEERERKVKEAEAEAARLAKEKAEEEAMAAELKEKEEERLREEELAKEKESESAAVGAGLAASLSRMSISGTSTPASDDSMGPPSKPANTEKHKKPAALNLAPLKTNSVEAAQPSAALTSLRSARFIDRLNDVRYPQDIVSPNPALNAAASNGKFKYEKEFLMQFQGVFVEKPSLDWDSKIRETVGDTPDSARPQSARPSTLGARNPSGRPGLPSNFSMGHFNQPGGKSLPPGTTSEQRFAMSSMPQQRTGMGSMNNPLAQFARTGGFPPGGTSMSRTNSSSTLQSNQGGVPQSPRTGSRSQRGSNRGNKPQQSAKAEEQAAKTMPLTANTEVKPLTLSTTGWKPRSLAAAATGAAGPTPGSGGLMEPDMVQRKVKAALNKMTPEKFDKIADQILEIASQSKHESDGRTLRQVIQLTFEKATDEAHWASMYAKFCKRMLEAMDPSIKDESIRDKNGNVVVGGNLFRKYLLNRCQEEFERGWKLNLGTKPEEEGQTEEATMLSEEYYIAAAAKRRGLGLVQFIGELYKLGMLTERIMHECVKKLVDYEGVPEEAEVESLTKLLKTIGKNLDSTEKGLPLMDVYFNRIQMMIDTPELPSRLRFMLMDVVDLRKKGWQSKEQDKGPKTIAEIRVEAEEALAKKEAERSRQNQRGGGRIPAGRGDARSFSSGGHGHYGGMMPPPDYQKNTVGMDDLRRLTNKGGARQASQQGPATFGPSAMFSSRSGSSGGRKNLGSGLQRGGEESGASSRTATPPAQKDRETSAHANNMFSALQDASSEPNDPTSPPSTASSPPMVKAKLEEGRSKSPVKDGSAGAS